MYILRKLLSEVTEDNKHPEIDFGPPIGREVINDSYGRIALAQMVTKLFEHWQLDEESQLALLGLSKNSRATLAGYRKGNPLGNRRDLLNRAAILLSIHKSLRILFPRNTEILYSWMTVGNKAFDGKTPVQMISDKGLPGLLAVQNYLYQELSR